VYLDFTTTYTAVELNQLDFIYTNPSIYACLEAQARSLAQPISLVARAAAAQRCCSSRARPARTFPEPIGLLAWRGCCRGWHSAAAAADAARACYSTV
jgi:hypothetical protein